MEILIMVFLFKAVSSVSLDLSPQFNRHARLDFDWGKGSKPYKLMPPTEDSETDIELNTHPDPSYNRNHREIKKVRTFDEIERNLNKINKEYVKPYHPRFKHPYRQMRKQLTQNKHYEDQLAEMSQIFKRNQDFESMSNNKQEIASSETSTETQIVPKRIGRQTEKTKCIHDEEYADNDDDDDDDDDDEETVTVIFHPQLGLLRL